MKKGEIFKLKKCYKDVYDPKCYNHPFIYWEDEHGDYRGIMLTTSNNPKFKNIPLNEEHVKSGFKFTFGKSEDYPISYIAPLYLLKDVKYDHLDKTGELTEHGIQFISSQISDLKYTTWKKYKDANF